MSRRRSPGVVFGLGAACPSPLVCLLLPHRVSGARPDFEFRRFAFSFTMTVTRRSVAKCRENKQPTGNFATFKPRSGRLVDFQLIWARLALLQGDHTRVALDGKLDTKAERLPVGMLTSRLVPFAAKLTLTAQLTIEPLTREAIRSRRIAGLQAGYLE